MVVTDAVRRCLRDGLCIDNPIYFALAFKKKFQVESRRVEPSLERSATNLTVLPFGMYRCNWAILVAVSVEEKHGLAISIHGGPSSDH
jgi:hypothetical protein